MKKSIEVKLDDKKIEVKKLPLRKYAELLGAIQELPKHVGAIGGLTPEQVIEKLPFLVTVAYPDIVSIVQVATDLPKEEIEELGLDELTDIAVAFFEINNYAKVFENIKKISARSTTAQPHQTNSNGSGGQ